MRLFRAPTLEERADVKLKDLEEAIVDRNLDLIRAQHDIKCWTAQTDFLRQWLKSTSDDLGQTGVQPGRG